MSRIPVTILGATGVVGQRFARRLADHPLFEVRHLAASDRSTGKTYEEACAWRLDGEPYAGLSKRTLVAAHPDAAMAPVVFSALDSGPAKEIEPLYAAAGAFYQRITGDGADSPIVAQRGDANQFSAGIGVGYAW